MGVRDGNGALKLVFGHEKSFPARQEHCAGWRLENDARAMPARVGAFWEDART
jgi:hypothetical protein